MVDPAEAAQAVGSPVAGELNLQRRQYADPPVVEAIARLQWATPVDWSFTTPGLLYERLRSLYSDEPQEQGVLQAGMSGAAGTGSEPPSLQVRSGPRRILFGHDGGTRLLGVSPIDLSVHGLPPYEGWESLRARLVEALTHTSEVLGSENRVRQVGLRYINRIELPEPTIQFGEYLTITLGFPPGFPPKITGFLDRTEMEYDDASTKLAFTWASTEPDGNGLAFVLDLDLSFSADQDLDWDRALDVLDDLKSKEGQAFEGLLQDKLRSQFGEIR